jgi:hypothetical protein
MDKQREIKQEAEIERDETATETARKGRQI